MRKLLWWLVAGSTGGPNRAKIIMELHKRPYNAHQLAENLKLNYKTVRHHLKVLEENGVITSNKRGYGELYFLSPRMEESYHTFQDIWEGWGENNNQNAFNH
jgi:DNA-binding transcriptional ArsR family regulator